MKNMGSYNNSPYLIKHAALWLQQYFLYSSELALLLWMQQLEIHVEHRVG